MLYLDLEAISLKHFQLVRIAAVCIILPTAVCFGSL